MCARMMSFFHSLFWRANACKAPTHNGTQMAKARTCHARCSLVNFVGVLETGLNTYRFAHVCIYACMHDVNYDE